MNKKAIATIIAAAVIIAAVTAVVVFVVNKNSAITTNSSETTYKAVKACDLLTLDKAKTLLGDTATLSEFNDPETGEMIATSNCSYTNNETALPTLRVIHVSVRSALDKKGQESNITAFESTNGSIPAAGDKEVTGYGEKAFWDTTVHRLAILKDNMWIRIGYGSSDQTTNTLEDAKKAARLVLD